MRSKYIFIAVVLVILGFAVGRLSAAPGTLDSPDVPANTQSYTLEDIYNRLDTDAGGAQSTFTEPAAGPGTGRMHTLNEIMAKAPLGGEETGPNPTDRGKSGSKRHLITEGKGIPMGTTLSGANRHDMKKAADTVDAIVVERPHPEEQEQHLCADKGYDYPETREEMVERGYRVHIPQRGVDTPIPEPGDPNRHPARRWVVERTHSWFNRFRKLLIRWEKKAEHWLGLIQFAACLIVYRRAFLG